MLNSGLRLSRTDYDEFFRRLDTDPMTETEIVGFVLDRLDREQRGEATGIGYDLYALALPMEMMDRILEMVRRERSCSRSRGSESAA